MSLTKHGICYDLSKSPYTVCLWYGQNVIYAFSSEVNKIKFIDRLEEHREKITNSLYKRFKMEFDIPLLCDIRLYDSIENRGFYIEVDGRVVQCLEEITLVGTRVDSEN